MGTIVLLGVSGREFLDEIAVEVTLNEALAGWVGLVQSIEGLESTKARPCPDRRRVLPDDL